MRKWLSLVVALGAAVFLINSSWGAQDIKVEGVIANWKEVKERIPPNAYFQLVKFREKMKGTTDAEGFAAFESKLPKIKVQDDGAFKLSVKELPEGNYFIALQRAVPKEIYGDSLASAIPLLITEQQEALVIRVPGSFPVKVGRVNVGVRAPKEAKPATPEKKAQAGEKNAPASEQKTPATQKAPATPEQESSAPEKSAPAPEQESSTPEKRKE